MMLDVLQLIHIGKNAGYDRYHGFPNFLNYTLLVFLKQK